MNPSSSSSKESGGGGGGGGGSGEPVKTTTTTTKMDLLDLKLGFGTASLKGMRQGCTSLLASKPTSEGSSSSSSLPSSQSTEEAQENIALGLNMGFETLNRRQVVIPSSSSESYDHGLWWAHNHHHHKQLGFGSHASTSSSSLSESPLRTLFLPAVPNVSHHHCSRRPLPAGLWFSLRSIINRDGEALPQVPKAYIRVKNVNVTVLMVKTYLVRKLGLSNESQVEISCMGQKLLHSQELKKVRDEIWLPKFIEFQSSELEFVQNSDISTVNIDHHLMPLDYGKCCLSVYI